MGGYIAEELQFGNPSTGSSNDIQQATRIARKMVCEWGMSETLGTVNYSGAQESVFIGRDMGHQNKPHSEHFAALIDEEIKQIVHTCLNVGRDMVKKNYSKFEGIAKALLAQETITAIELKSIMDSIPESTLGKSSPKSKKSENGGLKPALSA
jgi:cell division protease FtsH